MDYLAKKHEYTFWNNKCSLVRVHVTQVTNSPYNIWVEGKTKKYRDSVRLIEKSLKDFNRSELPPIIIVADSKIGSGGISSYNHDDDIIYYNSYYHNKDRINKAIAKGNFSAKNLNDIIQHELSHKLHWDAVKRFYHANKSMYNNINEAKHELDSQLENYIARQGNAYLILNVSVYADESFKYAKTHNPINVVNEVIAEVLTNPEISDPMLHNLIENELNYGKDK